MNTASEITMENHDVGLILPAGLYPVGLLQ